ncbi:hypothetical protein LLEC1_07641 [Akanthomyces lecanii]|uniref:N-acetylgalactosaminide beta-1,3-galactosyltransferase n=1 Tax=Cordyceps confragosa TaxID=2714763 RepID=A0A179IAQ3_CORDF|nr:hypothetical protein LLEC1_07641 [Akanthomyces lecanii]
MLNIPRRLRKRLLQTALLGLVFLSISYIVLPPDSSIRLALRFNAARASAVVRTATEDRDAWLRLPARYELDLREDVGYLIKTGYGTRHRVPLQLAALQGSYGGGLLGREGQDYIVVGDWTTVDDKDAKKIGVPVHDVLQTVREYGDEDWRAHHRFKKYQTLQSAIVAGDEETALEIGRSVGWELDALKFAPGMELMYKTMPNKKWYIILDDDTFVIKSTLNLFLSHLDPDNAHYIGNAVGDFRGRFAHGGSAIIISGAAMRRLIRRKDVVRQAYLESLDEKWGDKLVATTFLKLGIYLEERYAHHFNGESPEETRVTVAGAATKPVCWGELMELFRPAAATTAAGRDHVGPVRADKQVKTWGLVKKAADCERKCEVENSKWCLAWTYDKRRETCYASPWMVPGAGGAEGKVSGLNKDALKRMQARCR